MSIPLLNTFCRLAATSANKVPRPSNYSIATATGSKRSSADSDLLLCHVRLWRTSRELTDLRSKRGRRRRDGSQSIPLFVLFVLFGQAKRTLKEKYHKGTFLLSYFCMTKSAIKKKYLSFFSSKKRHRHFKNKRRKA